VPIHADHHLVVLIEGFEGGQSRDGLFHPYFDRIGQCWTIGFGHTEHVTSHTHALTKAEAEDLLLHDLNHAYSPAVDAQLHAYHVRTKLTQNQIDALIDLAYNCGVGILSPLHTIGQSLRAHNIKKAGEDLMLYVHGANGVVVQGLVNRRKADQKLYNSK
jgi:GH24 family phage-related lysozyme (muramidase)